MTWYGGPQGLDNSWIIWTAGLGAANVTGSIDNNTFHDDQCVKFATMVQQPWLRQRNNGYNIMTQGFANSPASWISAELYGPWYSDGPDDGAGKRFRLQRSGTCRATALLAGLPATEAELQQQMAAPCPPHSRAGGAAAPDKVRGIETGGLGEMARAAEEAVRAATQNIRSF